jgi:hypothetical protein
VFRETSLLVQSQLTDEHDPDLYPYFVKYGSILGLHPPRAYPIHHEGPDECCPRRSNYRGTLIYWAPLIQCLKLCWNRLEVEFARGSGHRLSTLLEYIPQPEDMGDQVGPVRQCRLLVPVLLQGKHAEYVGTRRWRNRCPNG